MADDRTDLQREYNEALKNEADELINLEALRENARQNIKDGTALTEAEKTAINELAASYKTLGEESERLSDKLNLARNQGDAVATAMGRATGMTQDFEKSLAGSVLALAESEDAMNSFTEKLGKMFTKQKIGLNILSKFKEATLELAYSTDEALVSFNKNTGATREYGTQIRALERDMFHHGVGISESAEAYGSLFTNVTALGKMSKTTQNELATTTGLLAHMGVSADTTAANVQFMTRSMGVSADEASQYQRELFTLAQEIGMPPEEMAAGFKAAAPKLMAFGKQAGKVFTKLAKNARAAGMEVEQLLGIVEQFDTFEGAAESVGKLNALLGGPFLNSMEMVMTTDPTERMRLLSGALNDAGKSFDQMSYYEKKSIAAAAGLSDVNELALVMAGSFDDSANGANKSQAEIEALAKQTKEFNTISQEFIQTMKMFALEMYPLVEIIKSILQGIQEWYGLFKKVTPAIIAMASAMMLWKTAGIIAKAVTTDFTIAWNASPFKMMMLAVVGWTLLSQVIGVKWASAAAIGTAALLGLAMAFGVLQVSTGGIIFIITSLVTGLIMLIQAIWGTDVGHSTMHEALDKLALTFYAIGNAVGFMLDAVAAIIPKMMKFLTPIGWLMMAWESMQESSADTAKNMANISNTRPVARADAVTKRDSLSEATEAAKTPVYKSDNPDGISAKASSKGQQAPPQKIETVVKVELNPAFERFFKAAVVKEAGKALNPNQGGS